MVAEAKTKINESDAKEAIKLFEDEDVIFVDIRDIRERQKLEISFLRLPCSSECLEFWNDPESPSAFKDIFDTDKKYSLSLCSSLERSALAVSTLKDMGFEATHISDGLQVG